MHIIRDPLWKNITIEDPLFEATKTLPFIRLQKIKQLGPTYLVYPGATHTRFSHSLGVYHLAKKLLNSLSQKGADSWISTEGRISFYAAALFHDIGHFPYTHSLKELPLKTHEELSAMCVLSEPIAKLIAQAGGNPEQTAAIIEKTNADAETNFYSKLLSGVLDPDKLDYLNRDAYFCGVPYGIQDTDFILDNVEPDINNGVKIQPSKMLSVENILFSKYSMYRSVYWHKNVRIATALMKKALLSALNKKMINPEELYQLDDNSVFTLLENISNLEEIECAIAVKNNQLYETIYETSFDEKNKLHNMLEDLKYRTEYETYLADKIGCKVSEIIIDVPERISFESNLLDEKITVFSSNTINTFTSSLRKIRIALKQQLLNEKKSVIIKSTLEEN